MSASPPDSRKTKCTGKVSGRSPRDVVARRGDHRRLRGSLLIRALEACGCDRGCHCPGRSSLGRRPAPLNAEGQASLAAEARVQFARAGNGRGAGRQQRAAGSGAPGFPVLWSPVWAVCPGQLPSPSQRGEHAAEGRGLREPRLHLASRERGSAHCRAGDRKLSGWKVLGAPTPDMSPDEAASGRSFTSTGPPATPRTGHTSRRPTTRRAPSGGPCVAWHLSSN